MNKDRFKSLMIVPKYMKDLPGLAGVKQEDLPGLPGVEEKEDLPGLPGVEGSEEYKAGYTKGYADALLDADGDNDGDEDDSQPNRNDNRGKKMENVLSRFAKRMLGTLGMLPLSSKLYSEINGVSVITIDGVLGKRLSEVDKMSGYVDVDDVTDALKLAEQSTNTHCVLMHFNSPGGESTGIQEAGECIKSMNKPTFAFCDTICGSAAYWLASCTQGIFVTPSSEVGSIGVYATVLDCSESNKMNGISLQVFSAGNLKTMGLGNAPLTDEEKEFIQNDINEQYAKFTSLVNENRGGVDISTMQGQVFNGEKAIGVNLADELVPDMETVIEQLTTE